MREDYSPHGNAWDYFPHDHARSRVYRWGEDGLAGFSDHEQRLCLSLALWNGQDPILKERLFGLTNSEGNHGEDVKELYYYLDATPTHSYMKMLYKYPQRAYPYAALVAENRRRGSQESEYELMDTGVLAENRYFDVFVEYAQAEVDDVLMRITVHNRGPEAASLHVLPQLFFRNTWCWRHGVAKPRMALKHGHVEVHHDQLGEYRWHVEGGEGPRVHGTGYSPTLLFTDNETNSQRLYGTANSGYVKDAFHERVVHDRTAAVNPAHEGTKASAW